MSWIIFEGIDRSYKSSASKIFESQGYKYIHFSAPDKKYTQPGYVGPSYLDDLTEMLISLSGQDVVFDRSWYGELIWPYVYGRNPLLQEDDIYSLREFEEQNSSIRILMSDPDLEAHWLRCVANKEPLTRSQFNSAHHLYKAMATSYGFEIKSKKDFEPSKEENKHMQPEIKQELVQQKKEESNVVKIETSVKLTPEQLKLQQANAINDVLSSRVVKKKGAEYDQIESRIRDFLNLELAKILGTEQSHTHSQFSDEEIVLLKALASRVKDKRA